jgi:peroxiredoxin
LRFTQDSSQRGELMAALEVGARAPDFDVPACTGEEKHRLKLGEYRGKKNIVLAFHPLNFTPA